LVHEHSSLVELVDTQYDGRPAPPSHVLVSHAVALPERRAPEGPSSFASGCEASRPDIPDMNE
jgi:hypothetical protein